MGVPLGYMLVWDNQELPPLRATFNRKLEKLDYFLNQVWRYLDWYAVTIWMTWYVLTPSLQAWRGKWQTG